MGRGRCIGGSWFTVYAVVRRVLHVLWLALLVGTSMLVPYRGYLVYDVRVGWAAWVFCAIETGWRRGARFEGVLCMHGMVHQEIRL